MERIETITKLIKEVSDTLRATRGKEVEGVRIISSKTIELVIQNLNSIQELVNKDNNSEITKLMNQLRMLIAQQESRNSYIQPSITPKPWYENYKQNQLMFGPAMGEVRADNFDHNMKVAEVFNLPMAAALMAMDHAGAFEGIAG